jgi:hypothetical protein
MYSPLPVLPRAPDKSEIIPFVLNTIREGQEEPFTLIFVAFRGKEGRKRGGVLWGFYSCFKKEKLNQFSDHSCQQRILVRKVQSKLCRALKKRQKKTVGIWKKLKIFGLENRDMKYLLFYLLAIYMSFVQKS